MVLFPSSAYSGNLVSNLTSPRRYRPLENFEQLINDPEIVAIYARGTAWETFLKRSPDKGLRELYNRSIEANRNRPVIKKESEAKTSMVNLLFQFAQLFTWCLKDGKRACITDMDIAERRIALIYSNKEGDDDIKLCVQISKNRLVLQLIRPYEQFSANFPKTFKTRPFFNTRRARFPHPLPDPQARRQGLPLHKGGTFQGEHGQVVNVEEKCRFDECTDFLKNALNGHCRIIMWSQFGLYRHEKEKSGRFYKHYNTYVKDLQPHFEVSSG